MDNIAPRSGVQTLDRAVAVLDAVARAAPCSLADLVRETGLARPTAHRLAVALEGHGLVVRDRDGRFRLGGRLVGWGAAAGAALALVEPARDILQRPRRKRGVGRGIVEQLDPAAASRRERVREDRKSVV